MEVEIRELERKYGGLRIADPGRLSRLTASIHQFGQQAPVLAVPGAAGGYVLIDGYARVSALEALARDVVETIVLPLSECEALVQSHRLGAGRRRSALEDGWLVRELVEGQGRRQSEVALALQRSVSWVSRRLALVGVLPESAQEAVRRGQIPAQAAMRVLVPLARAKAAYCEQLLAHLQGRPITVRQMATLYDGWKRADEEQRARILEHPWLYLKAQSEATPLEPTAEDSAGARLESVMETLVSLARQARRWIRGGAWKCADERQRRLIRASRRELDPVVREIDRLIEEEARCSIKIPEPRSFT